MILFEGAALDRRVTAEMAADAELCAPRDVGPWPGGHGRAADAAGAHTDRREVIRAGRPAMVEAIRSAMPT